MNVVELNITGSCKFTLTNYGESAYKDVCLEYTEHSTDHWHRDRETSIYLDAAKAAEIIGFLHKAFPELVTGPAQPAVPLTELQRKAIYDAVQGLDVMKAILLTEATYSGTKGNS